MTHDQRDTVPTLTDIAKAAEQEQAQEQREARERDRRTRWAEIEKYWDYGWKSMGMNIPPLPAYGDLERVTAPCESGRYEGDRSGWLIVIDDVRFLYCDEYGKTGLYVLLTCPDCGREIASTFYGLADLGKKLRLGRNQIYHHCEDLESRKLRSYISSAARDAGVSEQDLIERAMGW